MSRRPSFRLFLPLATTVMAALLLTSAARAEVEWHPDLATARAAARISRRPVLAVFTAAWDPDANAVEAKSLASPEAAAVLAACFEPVRIDVDEHGDLTRSVGITHVPTACVLAGEDAALVSFEMPDSPAAFVKAAILAAQRAAAFDDGATSVQVTDQAIEAPVRTPPEPNTLTAAAFGSTTDSAAAAIRPSRGSMARVTAKVRDLSAFAAGQGRPATAADPVTLAPAARGPADIRSDNASRAWPADTATASPMALGPRPAIEPATTPTAPGAASTWLDAAATSATTSRPASDGQPAPLPAPEQPAPRPDTGPSSLIAALQKPFGLLGKAATNTPTAPPALPRGPFAAIQPPAAPAADAAADAAAAQPPMPLGLEGYCPVTLVDRGVWKEGRGQWGARHRGRTYLFAGEDEQRTFLADPDRYAPALSGDDPVLALDRGSSTPGQRRYGVTYQARMYLFATPETRSAFTADPDRYVGRIALAERPAQAGTRLY